MTGHPLKNYRERNGLSQAQLGEKTGFDRITIWRWENGKRLPSPRQVEKLHKITGISARDLRPDLYALLERA